MHPFSRTSISNVGIFILMFYLIQFPALCFKCAWPTTTSQNAYKYSPSHACNARHQFPQKQKKTKMNSTRNISIGGTMITTTITNNPTLIDSKIEELKRISNPIIGLDVESKPDVSHGPTPNKASLLQLCNGSICLIIQLSHLPRIPNSLKSFLCQSNVTFVGVGIEADKAKLLADYGVACGKVVELGGLASRVYKKAEYEKYGLADLASKIAGVSVEKPQHVRVGDWSVGTLDEEQIKYATVDAYASFAVGKVLMGVK
ncbi:hypothetical protein QJS04_geneDACA015873 [Acorus gramineus]|uniref:3'-5' exonuclease domain-containing protein n=1 Tax=Acorus gramineus TaxID=55184 RepID=A0AAV9BLB5_ACOGR|nr:hypothetical protein QJS04_geneDACA015873 [Acorus gramineus]